MMLDAASVAVRACGQQAMLWLFMSCDDLTFNHCAPEWRSLCTHQSSHHQPPTQCSRCDLHAASSTPHAVARSWCIIGWRRSHTCIIGSENSRRIFGEFFVADPSQTNSCEWRAREDFDLRSVQVSQAACNNCRCVRPTQQRAVGAAHQGNQRRCRRLQRFAHIESRSECCTNTFWRLSVILLLQNGSARASVL